MDQRCSYRRVNNYLLLFNNNNNNNNNNAEIQYLISLFFISRRFNSVQVKAIMLHNPIFSA